MAERPEMADGGGGDCPTDEELKIAIVLLKSKFYEKVVSKCGISAPIKQLIVNKSYNGREFGPLLPPGGGGGGDLKPGEVLQFGEDKEFVQLDFEGEDTVHWFVKKRPITEELIASEMDAEGRPNFELELAQKYFAKEVCFYTRFLPDALAFVEEKDEFKDVNLKSMFAKCHYADKDIIVLDNLLAMGFTMTDVRLPHSFFHAQAVLENLGLFHSVTRAMIQEFGMEEFKKKYPLFAEEVDFPREMKDHPIAKVWEVTVQLALVILKVCPVEAEGFEDAVQFFEKQKSIFNDLCDQVKIKDEDLIVALNIGDLWQGSVLVKKDDKGKYLSTVFVDMKMARIGSSLLDVSCYMFSCVADHIRYTQWKYLIDVFLEFITKGSEALLGADADLRIKLTEFTTLYVGKALFGIMTSLEHLITKFYAIPLIWTEEGGFDFSDFEEWLKGAPPKLKDCVAFEVVGMIRHYQQCLTDLSETK